MKVIDNRYRIENMVENGGYFESYKVKDLWSDDRIQYLKIYNSKVQNDIIKYYIDNFRFLSNIRHESLLSCEQFSLMKTIDTKRTNMLLYYSVTEYNDNPKLSKVIEYLSLKERLNILLEVMLVMDFLHFRGVTYRYLNPDDIFIHNNKEITITDLSTIYERKVNNYYNELSTYFLSPDFLNNKEDYKQEDYYSIGILIKYMLLENLQEENLESAKYKDELEVTREQKEQVNIIIDKLTKRNEESSDIGLIEIIDNISEIFNLNYSYDLTKYRGSLHFQGKIVGREKDINKIISIDEDIVNGNIKYKGILIKSDKGIGKTRLISEISHQLKLRGRNVYSVEILENKNKDLLYISNILKQSIVDAPPELMEKYRYELSKILPELRVNILDNIEEDFNQKTETFRLYNRITNYFSELAKNRIIYIIIDDLHYMNNNALILVDYLIKNIKNNNIFFVFSFNDNIKEQDPLVMEKINQWIGDSIFMEMELYKLNLQEIGEMLKNILGISYTPINFGTVLFKEGQGNPRYIEYIVKQLFSINELYMHREGKWLLKAEQFSDIHFPTNMQDALKKQRDIIKENYFEIFKAMSIFNDIINKRLLFDMLEEKDEDKGDLLDQLIGLGLIDEKLADWGYGYSIGGSELKRLIYSELSWEEKIDLHGRAADIMEENLDEEYDIDIEELIFHLIESNQSQRALKLIFKKANRIQNEYSSHMLFLCEKAYEILESEVSEVKLNVLKKILRIYFLKGVSEKGNLYLEEYQREAEILNSYKHIINAKYWLTEKYFRAMKLEKGLEEVSAIEKIANEHNFDEGKIIALIIRIRFELKYGEIKDLSPELNLALQLSNILGIEKYLGNIYNLMGLNEFLKGNKEEAIKNYEKSIYFYQEKGEIIEVSKPMNNIGSIYAEEYGNLEKAMEYYRKGLGIARKFGFQESEMIFLNNISEIYIKNNEFDKALGYIDGARKIAIEIGDLNIEFLSNINLGFIQLYTGNYEGAYEIYKNLEEMYENRGVLDVEVDTQYNNFLGDFYGSLGQWEKSIYYSKIASNLCKAFNIQEYLKAESRILNMKFFKDSYFNKEEINKLLEKYGETELIQDRRTAILTMAAISGISGDVNYGKELLEEDLELSKLFKNNLLEEMREMIIYSMQPLDESIDKMIDLGSRLTVGGIYDIGLFWKTIIGYKLFENNLYEEAIKYLLDSLDNIYRIILKIPDLEFQISYIESRNGDLIKEKMIQSFEKVFNKKLEYTSIRDVREKGIFNYFDISSLFEVIGSEELIRVAKLGDYGKAMEIKSIKELIGNLTGNFKYNLNLLLRYLSKESFAKTGVILSYDEDLKEHIAISSLGRGINHRVNTNILNLSSQNGKGILINVNIEDKFSKRYKNLLLENVKAIICVPIFAFEEEMRSEAERRKGSFEEREIKGYIYLETDKVFNRFDFNRLEEVINLSYLVNINLENSKLQLIATTDKLTGTATRKHYELKFEQLIADRKSNKGIFSVVLLDIDDFKNVNDSYGHRKGDEVLKILGDTLKDSVRSSDLVARYGGEEFIILLKSATEADSISIAEKIRSRVENLKIPGIDYPITISLGISLYPNHSHYKEDLVEKADQALYYAKEMGKNRVELWDNKMDSTLNRADKLAGILTGNMNDDNRNILAIMDIIDLIKMDISLDDKIFMFLGRLLETINAEFATIILEPVSKKGKVVFTRTRFNDQWVQTPKLNYNIIGRIMENEKGEYLIDWDNTDNLDPLSGLPNWQSVIVFPIIRNGDLKGIIYISAPIQLKEFDFDIFNISKIFGNIFAGIL